VRRLVGALRSHWPTVEILLRADSHYASPGSVRLVPEETGWIGSSAWPPNAALCRHVRSRWRRATAAALSRRAPGHGQGAALPGNSTMPRQSWSRVERIIARVEGRDRGDRYPGSSSPAWKGGPRPSTSTSSSTTARGAVQAENHIKAWKNHLAADRTSCHAARGQPVFVCFLPRRRLFGSYGRCAASCPKHSVVAGHAVRHLAAAPGQTPPARVVELKTQVKIHLPTSAPDQAIFAMLLDRLPRLVT